MNFKKLFSLLLVLGLAVVVAACSPKDDDAAKGDFTGLNTVYITVGSEETFNPTAGVTGYGKDGNPVFDFEVEGADAVDTSKVGVYEVKYSFKDGDDDVVATRKVVVDNFANGTYSFRFATSELRNTFFGAAERYLLDTLYGGIPLFANAGFNMYSSRITLPTEEYLPVMGYGATRGDMAQDDAEAFGGTAGKKTYRLALTSTPTYLNQWEYQDSVESDVMSLYLDGLYAFDFNEDMDGYQIVPSMAEALPRPLDRVLDEEGEPTEELVDINGIVVSRVWQVDLKDGLKFQFNDAIRSNPDISFNTLPDGHEDIDAHKFIETFKLAIDNNWFRARTGGGDFFSSTQAIKNAQAYHAGGDDAPEWEDVGLKAIDESTLQFEFVNQMSEWNVIYWLSSFVMSPIHLEIYERLQDGETNTYGTDAATTPSTGPYVLDYFEADVEIRLTKNTEWHSAEKYNFTDINFTIQADATTRFNEFIAGNLDATGLPTEQFENYKNDPRVKFVPGATTFRIMINGLGTVENQRAQFPDSRFTPEPLLANKNFKKAMYHVIDREYLALEIMKTSQPQMFLFTESYLVDPASGVPFRNTAEGAKVGEGLSVSTHAYNLDLAKSYWEAAIKELVEAGVYDAGGFLRAGDTIEIDFIHQAGSESQTQMAAYVKKQFEDNFKYEKIKVVVNPKPTAFPGLYYDYMMPGDFDLGTGGISGSTLDAASFLDVFSSDNRGGFTLNWGFDTSLPEIPVTYKDPDSGETITEVWSFDAIVSALTDNIEVVNGMEK